LAARHLQDGHLVLYDITSSYFEGAYTHSEIVTFGYNRDGERGHEQMVIALLCSAEGRPVGVEVFAGNTQDASTVVEKIAQLQRKIADAKRRASAKTLGARVSRVLERSKMGNSPAGMCAMDGSHGALIKTRS
jgi:hypothetical protein